ncbi:MAG: cysteine desulfurase family protein [Hyphomicrobium sp.]
MSQTRTYLDYNATAPLRPEAREAMVRALDTFGNPSSVHAEGRRARAIVEEAREAVAVLVNAKPSEVVFTSGATEANAWAISGALSGQWAAILVSAAEHDSVRGPASHYAALKGIRVNELAVSVDGIADLGQLDAPKDGSLLLALQLANNETGVIQDVARAAALGAEHRFSLHTDAVQAAGRMVVDFRSLGATTLSLSAHKLGGPKGVGALVIRDGYELPALIPGGGQERRRRAGTENVAAIAGFGSAAKAALAELDQMSRVAAMRDGLEAEVVRLTPEAVCIGSDAPRLPNTSCIALPGQAAETLVIKLDLAGIAVSAGAACSSGKVGQSHVLTAMGLAPDIARSAIRVSIGTATTEQDLAAFVAAWNAIGNAGRLAA